MQKIYIIVSKTPTILAKAIRFLFKTEYSHVSISLDDSCENMLSFGRKYHWFPFYGELAFEGKNVGFFKHFKNSEITLFEMDVSDINYNSLVTIINNFKKSKEDYSFNVFGMLLSGLGISYGKKNSYFCSEFVSHLLKESNIYDFNKDNRLVKPHEFANLPKAKKIYKGKISKYIKNNL